MFVKDQASEPLLPSHTISDLGQTTSWLLDMQVKPWQSKKRQQIVLDILKVHNVKQEGGAFEIAMRDYDELMDDIVRLGQACARVADLTFLVARVCRVASTKSWVRHKAATTLHRMVRARDCEHLRTPAWRITSLIRQL